MEQLCDEILRVLFVLRYNRITSFRSNTYNKRAIAVQTILARNWRSPEALASLVVLAILLVFTFGLFFLVPYQGFYFNPSNGEVLTIYPLEGSNPGLKVGDIIERVGPVTFEMYQTKRVPFFSPEYKTGGNRRYCCQTRQPNDFSSLGDARVQSARVSCSLPQYMVAGVCVLGHRNVRPAFYAPEG